MLAFAGFLQLQSGLQQPTQVIELQRVGGGVRREALHEQNREVNSSRGLKEIRS